MECGRPTRFVVDTAEPASYWACERHVQQVKAHRRGIKVEEVTQGNFVCCWKMMTVGEILEIVLDGLGWTQKKLSKISGIPQQSISELIRHKKRLIPVTALRLAAALSLDPLAMLATQADYALWVYEKEHPELIGEVRARLPELIQDGE